MFNENKENLDSKNEEEKENSEENQELEESNDLDSEESEEEDVDSLKEKLEEERKLREKAESSLQYHKEKLKEKKVDPDAPVTQKDLEELKVNLVKSSTRKQIEAEASRIARDEEERKQILEHYDNSIVPTGDPAVDLNRAFLLANEDKIRAENEELVASLESRESRSPAISSGKPPVSSKEPQLDPETKKLVDMNKMKWDAKKGLFVNERGVTYDPRTGNVKDPRRA